VTNCSVKSVLAMEEHDYTNASHKKGRLSELRPKPKTPREGRGEDSLQERGEDGYPNTKEGGFWMRDKFNNHLLMSSIWIEGSFGSLSITNRGKKTCFKKRKKSIPEGKIAVGTKPISSSARGLAGYKNKTYEKQGVTRFLLVERGEGET